MQLKKLCSWHRSRNYEGLGTNQQSRPRIQGTGENDLSRCLLTRVIRAWYAAHFFCVTSSEDQLRGDTIKGAFTQGFGPGGCSVEKTYVTSVSCKPLLSLKLLWAPAIYTHIAKPGNARVVYEVRWWRARTCGEDVLENTPFVDRLSQWTRKEA